MEKNLPIKTHSYYFIHYYHSRAVKKLFIYQWDGGNNKYACRIEFERALGKTTSTTFKKKLGKNIRELYEYNREMEKNKNGKIEYESGGGVE